MGQFPYKKYEQLQKQREKANRYMQQSKENYQKEIRQLIFKVRRRIETSLSQLTEQLN